MDYYTKPFKQIIDFKGRTTRREYWMFFLINILIISLLCAIAMVFTFFAINSTDGSAGWIVTFIFFALSIYLIVLIIPSISITVRRLHDIGLSGWWFLIGYIPYAGGFALFLMTVLPGTKEDNKYGVSPYKKVYFDDSNKENM